MHYWENHEKSLKNGTLRYNQGAYEQRILPLSLDIIHAARLLKITKEEYLEECDLAEKFETMVAAAVNEMAVIRNAVEKGSVRYRAGDLDENLLSLSENLDGLAGVLGQNKKEYLEQKGFVKEFNDLVDATAESEIAHMVKRNKNEYLRYDTGLRDGSFGALSNNLDNLAGLKGKTKDVYLEELGLSYEFQSLVKATTINEIAVTHDQVVRGDWFHGRSSVYVAIGGLIKNLHHISRDVGKDPKDLLASTGNFDFKVNSRETAISKFVIVEAFNGNNNGITNTMLDDALAAAPKADGIREKFEEQALRFATAANLGCFWRNTLPQRFDRM